MDFAQDLTTEKIDAFTEALRAMVDKQSLAFSKLPVQQRDFDRVELRQLFADHGFGADSNWIGVDFSEPDVGVFLNQLQDADEDHLGTLRMLLQAKADGRFESDKPAIDFDEMVVQLGFDPEEFR